MLCISTCFFLSFCLHVCFGLVSFLRCSYPTHETFVGWRPQGGRFVLEITGRQKVPSCRIPFAGPTRGLLLIGSYTTKCIRHQYSFPRSHSHNSFVFYHHTFTFWRFHCCHGAVVPIVLVVTLKKNLLFWFICSQHWYIYSLFSPVWQHFRSRSRSVRSLFTVSLRAELLVTNRTGAFTFQFWMTLTRRLW